MKWTLTEAHVDWITITAPTGPEATALYDLGATIQSEQREGGNDGRRSGFEGYRGTASKHCFIGWRLDGSCVRLGGPVARDWWRRLCGPGRNVTRLDLAVTLESEPYDPDYPRACWHGIPNRPSEGGRPTEYTLIQARIGGATLYCGSRSSEVFGRIYDKHKESKGEWKEGSFRFEVEYKGETARLVAGYLSERADVEAPIIGVLRRRFADWGVALPVRGVEPDWRPGRIPNLTSDESRMKWLREQVRLSIEKMSGSFTADELRLALGLQFGKPQDWIPRSTAAYEPVKPEAPKRVAWLDMEEGGVVTDVGDWPKPDHDPTGADGDLLATRPKLHRAKARGEGATGDK